MKSSSMLSREEICELPRKDRKKYLEKIDIRYPRVKAIDSALEDAYDDAPDSSEPPSVALIGLPGVGKTTILKRVARNHPSSYTKTGTHRPVVRSVMPSRPTLPSVAGAILIGMHDPLAGTGSFGAQEIRIRRYLDDLRTRQLQFDDVQHASKFSKQFLIDTSDWIKNLIKDRPISCVFAGTPNGTEDLLKSNEQLGQLFGDPLVLEPFKWDEKHPETIQEFLGFLIMLEKQLPLKFPSNLVALHTARPIYVACGGNTRLLMRLIRKATSLSFDTTESIGQKQLEDAFDQRLAPIRRGVSNPFSASASQNRSPKARPKTLDPRATNNRSQRRKIREETIHDIVS